MTHPLQDALLDITEALEDIAKAASKPATPPAIALPEMEAPEVEVNIPPAPRKWIGEVLERDASGFIKRFSLTAIDDPTSDE
jgi:hypothetical protein